MSTILVQQTKMLWTKMSSSSVPKKNELFILCLKRVLYNRWAYAQKKIQSMGSNNPTRTSERYTGHGTFGPNRPRISTLRAHLKPSPHSYPASYSASSAPAFPSPLLFSPPEMEATAPALALHSSPAAARRSAGKRAFPSLHRGGPSTASSVHLRAARTPARSPVR